MLRLAALPPLFSLLFAASAHSESLNIRKAVFSDRQLFWPGLAGGTGASASGKDGKAQPAGPSKAAAAPARIAVLPLRITDYQESIPCDSCHRLSANGMEFFLENYFKDKLRERFPPLTVELIAPHLPLVESRLNLMAYLDSLELPWEKWLGLADSGQDLIYRPRDRFTKPAAVKRLDRLGGMLGAAYILLPARVHVKVTPNSSTSHQGGLDWGFFLVFWNVAAGAPEWALRYSAQTSSMDLDESLQGRLDKDLGAAWDGLPGELAALRQAEPH